jgi:hypothetical protein
MEQLLHREAEPTDDSGHFREDIEELSIRVTEVFFEPWRATMIQSAEPPPPRWTAGAGGPTKPFLANLHHVLVKRASSAPILHFPASVPE